MEHSLLLVSRVFSFILVCIDIFWFSIANNEKDEKDEKDEKEKIQKWLNAPDCAMNFQAADDKRTEGTGQWILNDPEYIKWKQSPSTLWIQGKAGSGKTILL
ncbi:hypothetical protein GYMLUDRAFT_48919 [Collybiopsis luxurians FD-317 M1]|uniref:Nephrocystin 3-like N-terminal domain-containing protein n=1 Tax=Collybiopsis luxurians FD-317 M1 TaxID=944289 RepID=A0A0D0CH26_9AGAR|nr:hypothetical protein GYMLUDRAFT_48919 [Collybiopsis luxurians FD-317 M1]